MKPFSINNFLFNPSIDCENLKFYRGQWQLAEYWVNTPTHWIDMSGILQTVCSTWPEQSYHTTKPISWPRSTFQGVLRGPSTGTSMAQFQVQSQAGIVFITFYSDEDIINKNFVDTFFESTVITPDSFDFPDNGNGYIFIDTDEYEE